MSASDSDSLVTLVACLGNSAKTFIVIDVAFFYS
jgi:hypothetical protein